MSETRTLEIPISGMDCAECTQHVQHAIAKLPGVQSVNVFLSTEKAVVRLDPGLVQMTDIRSAVKGAGYDVPASGSPQPAPVSMGAIPADTTQTFNRRLTVLLAGVFAIILSVVIFGEILGAFGFLNERIPFLLGLALVIGGRLSRFPERHPRHTQATGHFPYPDDTGSHRRAGGRTMGHGGAGGHVQAHRGLRREFHH
jgi:Cd2+/Zn2+-exporting ATPase/Cu+-exporting ATPase